jgi:hypothetical protein
MENHELLSDNLEIIFKKLGLKLNIPTLSKLSILVSSLLEGVPAHLSELAQSLPDKWRESSDVAKEQRVRRFLSNKALSPKIILPVLLRLLRPILVSAPNLIISMDRTCWKKRKCHINVLTVALSFNGRAIPLFWSVLDYKGNSSLDHWKQVLSPVIENFQSLDWLKDKNIIVVADREFGSPILAQWLKENYDVDCALRTKRSFYLKDGDYSIKLSEILNYFVKGQTIHYPNTGITKNNDFKMNVVISWNPEYKEPLILATTFHEPKLSIEYYEQRFGIEPMFKDTKSNAFDIEKTKVTDPKRIESLWIIMALAYALSTVRGYMKEQENENANKKKSMEKLLEK